MITVAKIKQQHRLNTYTEIMSLHTLNLLHENSSTNSNLTSNNTHYPIATVNGISKSFHIYNNKINQQQDEQKGIPLIATTWIIK